MQINNEIVLRQKSDGQVRVSMVRVTQEELDKNPFIKQQLKSDIEQALEKRGIMVFGDVGGRDF